MAKIKNPVLIDWETKGNVVRLYFGDIKKAWGDDWNDAPYEHNAGTVYSEFVEFTVDIIIDFDLDVIEPNYGHNNSGYTKEQLIQGKKPLLFFLVDSWRYRDYEEVVNAWPLSIKAGMKLAEVVNPETHGGAIIGVYKKDEKQNNTTA